MAENKKQTRAARTTEIKYDTLDKAQTAVIEDRRKIFAKEFFGVWTASGLTQKEFANVLHPSIENGNVVSKIANQTDNRYVNLKILMALRFAFNFSIDKAIDDALAAEYKRQEKDS